MSLVERVARAIAENNGYDPDAPRWTEYANQAQTMINALLPKDDGSINVGIIRDYLKGVNNDKR